MGKGEEIGISWDLKMLGMFFKANQGMPIKVRNTGVGFENTCKCEVSSSMQQYSSMNSIRNTFILNHCNLLET